MKQETIEAINLLTGRDYLSSVCDINVFKAIFSFCLTVIFALFGANHVPIMIVGALWIIDTVTGVMYAVTKHKFESSIGFKKGGIKLYVIGTTFVTMTLLAQAYPELAIAPTITASFFVLNEVYSIIENLNKLRPNAYFEVILHLIGSAEAKLTETVKTLNKKN